MKFEQTQSFKRDCRRLESGELEMFKATVLERFAPAAERFVVEAGSFSWPSTLRVKDVEGAKGVWELTWSFTDPDGRATFEWVTIDGEPGIRWRRVGSHAIFNAP